MIRGLVGTCVALMAVAIIAGCGGSLLPSVNITNGGGGGSTGTNPYVGSYSGTYTQSSPNANGTATVQISGTGAIAGTLSTSPNLPSETLSGSVDNSGNAKITYGGFSATYSGVFNTSASTVVATLTAPQGSTPAGITFTLTKQ